MFSSRGLGVHSRAHGVMDVERQAEWLARYKKLGMHKTSSVCEGELGVKKRGRGVVGTGYDCVCKCVCVCAHV